MATEDQTREEWERRELEFQGKPKKPRGLSERWADVWDDLDAQAEALPKGKERDEVLAGMREIANKVKEMRTPPEKTFDEAHIKTRTERVLKDGRYEIEEVDQHGNVRKTRQSREDAEKQWAAHQSVIDRVAQAREDRGEAKRQRELAGLLAAQNDPAAEGYYDQARALMQKANQTMEELREIVPPEQWKNFDLGRAPEPLRDGVQEALDLLSSDAQVEAITAAFHGLDPHAQAQFWERAAPEYRNILELMKEGVS